ncbi:hypothetical protein LCGC14_3038570, partial [marine sediment metagenome]
VWVWDTATWGGLWGSSYTDTHADALNVRLDTERIFADTTVWDVDRLYARIYYAPLLYEINVAIEWDPPLANNMQYLYYDYSLSVGIDFDLDIYNYDTTGWLELESNSNTNWHTDTELLTNPYIDGDNDIKIRFQSTTHTSSFNLYIDQAVIRYDDVYTISKKHNNAIDNYIFVQTDTTETLTIESWDFGENLTFWGEDLSITHQTTSTKQINVLLVNDDVIQLTIELSANGNGDFTSHTEDLSITSNVIFDQIKFTGEFDDTKYLKVTHIEIHVDSDARYGEADYLSIQTGYNAFLEYDIPYLFTNNTADSELYAYFYSVFIAPNINSYFTNYIQNKN